MKLTNKHLEALEADHFHHLGFDTQSVDVKKKFHDVKVNFFHYFVLNIPVVVNKVKLKSDWLMRMFKELRLKTRFGDLVSIF